MLNVQKRENYKPVIKVLNVQKRENYKPVMKELKKLEFTMYNSSDRQTFDAM